MYSSLQQQCLVELGVIPYDLNDTYQQSNDLSAQSNASINGETTAQSDINTEIQPQITRPRPVAKPIKTAAPKQDGITSKPVPTSVTIDYWAQCSAEFITDLTVVFPDVKLSVAAFDGLVAQLSEHVFWKVAPKMRAQYVQLESIGQETVITSPLPAELTLSQKKELWLLLLPYAPQLTTEN